MKKTLKLVGIFAAILVSTIAIALGGYILITQNQTYYIYNVEFVEPTSAGYIYTQDTGNYSPMHDKVVYLKSNEENNVRLAVLALTSNNSRDVVISSSNPNVATIIYQNGLCYAHFKSAGTTKITAELQGVTDSFTLYVYSSTPTEFVVYDYDYYGKEEVTNEDGSKSYKFADEYPNRIVCYADDKEHKLNYRVYDEFGNEDNEKLNQSAFEVVYYDKTLFNSVSIDGKNKTLNVNCKRENETNSETYILVQSYYLSGGQKKIQKQYVVNVRIVIYEAEFLQAVISTSPNFEDQYVLLNIENVTEDDAKEDTSKVEKLLSVRRATTTIVQARETPTFVAYCTPKVPKLYLKFRLVYTNNDIVYLDGENADDFVIGIDPSYTDGSSETKFFRQDPSGGFYELMMDAGNCDISFTIYISNAQHTLKNFTVKFVELTSENIDKFYTQNEDGTYTFTYYDERTRFLENEIYDVNGNIIGFGGF